MMNLVFLLSVFISSFETKTQARFTEPSESETRAVNNNYSSLQASTSLIPRNDVTLTLSSFSFPKQEFYIPFAAGDGWIPPSSVITDPVEDNWTPMIAVDANGVLWCTENTFESGYYAAIGIYYSTDLGNTWNFATYVVANIDLGDPTIAIDVQRSPNKMYISFWGRYSASDYDAGYYTFDISGTSLINGSGGWLETSVLNVAGPSIVMVERGYSTNYAFIAWENRNGSTYQIRVARSTNYGSSWTILTIQSASSQYLGQVWGNAGNATNPCILINYKWNPSGTSFQQATRAVLAYSTNRGASYSTTSRDFTGTGYVFQTSSAIGFGSNYVVWAIQVNPNPSDGNIFIRYSTDRCASWANEYYMENEMVTLKDSRMPIVCADGMQQSNYTSQYFYIGFFRETISGSGRGNYFFKMAPVSNAATATSWFVPSNIDSFAIADENSYSVKEANWAQLHLTSFIMNGSYIPGLVWNHEVTSSNHDIYFTRPIEVLYEEISEESKSNKDSNFLTIVSENPFSYWIKFQVRVKSDSSSISLKIYDIKGNLVKTLAERKHLNQGVYEYSWVPRQNDNYGIYIVVFKNSTDNFVDHKIIIYRSR